MCKRVFLIFTLLSLLVLAGCGSTNNPTGTAPSATQAATDTVAATAPAATAPAAASATATTTSTSAPTLNCATPSAQSLGFTGVEGLSNPATQAIKLTNCGLQGIWSTYVTPPSWLSVSPTSGTIATSGSTNLTITVANLAASLVSGTYTGTIAVTLGSATITITVALTVVPGLNVSYYIGHGEYATYTSNFTYSLSKCADVVYCSFTLTNMSRTASLTWSAKETINSSLKADLNSNGGTLDPGFSKGLILSGYTQSCNNSGTIFTITINGPGNTVVITLTC